MTLSVRPEPYVVPTYSLTGDLLAYLTCGLQYRYHNKGSLPPSKPVQMWFGQFIHGVMEEAYRSWRTDNVEFPWNQEVILPLVDLISRRLNARGLSFRNFQLLSIAVERAFVAINLWGPFLFPLITEAEVRLQGIRPFPVDTESIRQSGHYEVEGVADVISSISLAATDERNPIAEACKGLGLDDFEVIVDYKGMRRPSMVAKGEVDSWKHQRWQVLTYSWLRQQQVEDAIARIGMVLYLNEVAPGIEDMDRLCDDVFAENGILRDPQSTHTDVIPLAEDLDFLRNWKSHHRHVWREQFREWHDSVRDWWFTARGNQANDFTPFPRMPDVPNLSEAFRLKRALRIVPITDEEVDESLASFDNVIQTIEGAVSREAFGSPITVAWQGTPREETCTVCDFHTYCPAEGNRYRRTPSAP